MRLLIFVLFTVLRCKVVKLFVVKPGVSSTHAPSD